MDNPIYVDTQYGPTLATQDPLRHRHDSAADPYTVVGRRGAQSHKGPGDAAILAISHA